MAKKGKKEVFSVKQENVRKVTEFLGVAFEDYIGARVLLNAGLLTQGAVLASTAIEKYFKAIMASRGMESHGHLKTAHWKSVRDLHKELYERLKEDFLQLCKKSYEIRYTDQLGLGFNIVIAQREFLAELDAAVAMIEPSFIRDNNERLSKYQHFQQKHDVRLIHNNHVLLGIPKENFIYSEVQLVQELRQTTGGLMEATYTTMGRPSDPSMMRVGLAQDPSNPASFKLTHDRNANNP